MRETTPSQRRDSLDGKKTPTSPTQLRMSDGTSKTLVMESLIDTLRGSVHTYNQVYAERPIRITRHYIRQPGGTASNRFSSVNAIELFGGTRSYHLRTSITCCQVRMHL